MLRSVKKIKIPLSLATSTTGYKIMSEVYAHYQQCKESCLLTTKSNVGAEQAKKNL